MNKKNKYCQLLYATLLVVGIGNVLFAQQIPVFNQYLFNPEFYNSAAVGEGFVAVQYRSQFSGLDSRYAPKSYAIHADLSPVLGLFEKRIGIGLSLLSDKAHIVNQLKGKINFAYHLIKNKNNKLSAGVEAGLFTQRMDFKDVRISDPQDIVLYDGDVKESTFDGGLGLRYVYGSDSGHEFNFNLAIPQLFTSDLVYEEDKEFAISPHLLTTISYKIPIGHAAIEPAVMYREVLGEKSLKEGQLDLGFRALFLEERIWIGSGIRLDASTYNFSLGFQIVNNFHFMGSFETHNVLGNTWEVGLVYRFDRKKKQATSFDNYDTTESTAITDQLAQIKIETEKSKAEVSKWSNQAKQKIKEIDRSIEAAQKIGADNITIQSEIQKADLAMGTLKSIIERAIDPALVVNNKRSEGAALYKKAFDENATNKKINNSWNIIEDLEDQSSQAINNLIHSYTQSAIEIAILKGREKTNASQLSSLVRDKDVVKLQSYFQQKLSTALGITDNALPVVVTTDGLLLKLKYEYAHSQPDFKLERTLSEPRFIADHINEQIKMLEIEDVKIENIVIAAKLQSRKSSLEETTLDTRYNENQFGPYVNVKYRFFDELEKTIESLEENVSSGEVNLLELTCLKLYGLKRYIERNGGVVSKASTELELRAPNYEQIHSEIYSITIEFK